MDRSTTLQSIRGWPLADRVELVLQLWDEMLDEGWQPTIDDDLKAELDRRWANYQANPGSGLTWEQVAAQVRRPR